MISESQRRNLQYSIKHGGRIPLLIELTQLEEEGKDTIGLREKIEEIWETEPLLEREKKCETFLSYTYSLPVKVDYPYCEPDEYNDIRAQWGDVSYSEVKSISEAEYLEQVHGGFLIIVV